MTVYHLHKLFNPECDERILCSANFKGVGQEWVMACFKLLP